MRRDLRGDVHASGLGFAHEPDGARRGQMRDVHVRARELGEQDIAAHHDVLRRRRNAGDAELGGDDALVHGAAAREVVVLGVADDGASEGQRVLHGAPEEGGVHDALAVVGEGHAAGLCQLRELGERLAPQAPRDGADGVHAHDALAGGLGEDVVGDGAVVVDRVRVGHARDGREAARGRRARAGGHRLLVLVAGLAQVHVDVDEAGTHDLAGGVDDGDPVGGGE
jgi:hypothetical protein